MHQAKGKIHCNIARCGRSTRVLRMHSLCFVLLCPEGALYISPGSAIAPPWGVGSNKNSTLKGLHRTCRHSILSNPFRVREERVGFHSQGGAVTDRRRTRVRRCWSPITSTTLTHTPSPHQPPPSSPAIGSRILIPRDLRLAAAVKWYEMGILSQKKAAEAAGLC